MRHRSSRPGRAYFTAPNAMIQDEDMSGAARFVISLMMSYPDDWDFHIDYLRKKTGFGRDKLRLALREAEANGYLIRETLRGEDGLMVGSQWILIDDPSQVAELRAARSQAEAKAAQVEAEKIDDLALGGAAETPVSTAEESPHRPPENPAVGFSGAGPDGPPENPAVGKHGHILILKDTKNPLNPLSAADAESAGETGAEAATESRKRGRSAKAGAVVDSAKVDEEALARLWAPKVIEGRRYVCSAIRSATAQTMLRLRLVSEAQLSAVGVAF